MRIQRLLGLLCVLGEVDKITVQELAKRFEVSKRTIFRDLEMLNCAGIPIVSYPGVGGGVAVLKNYKVDKKILSTEDTGKLFTALNGLKSIDNDSSITNLIAKMAPGQEPDLPSPNPYMLNLSSWFSDSITTKKAAAFHQAIEGRRLVRLDYISRTSRVKRTVEPYKLVFKQSYWYLYAFCQEREDFRMFRLNRIASFEVLEEHFPLRQIKNPEFKMDFGREIFSFQNQDGFFEVVLRYDRSKEYELTQKIDASFFSSPESQRGSEHLQEKGEIRFFTSDLSYTANLVMGLLDKVQVISPPELYNEIKERLNKINLLYKG